MVGEAVFRHTGHMPISGNVLFEELTPEECLLLLDLASVGRIGLSVQALPVILPVNFVMHEGDVIFRVGSGTKLAPPEAVPSWLSKSTPRSPRHDGLERARSGTLRGDC